MELTVSMAAFRDYDGVYFTVQSLRLHHALPAATEFLILDNGPPDGCHARALQSLARRVPGLRVIPVGDRRSPWVKYDAFRHARGRILLGLDCHVLLAPGFLPAMLAHWRDHPSSRDLLTGPLLGDGLRSFSVKMEPQWRGQDFGTWADDPADRAAGEPFEIPMQGMACWSLLRPGDGRWPLPHPGMRGFGAEEWYMAEKVRRLGGRVLCHPALGWLHRFGWPPPTFPLSLAGKCENYLRGWCELYGTDHPMVRGAVDHFATLLPSVDSIASRVFAEHSAVTSVQPFAAT